MMALETYPPPDTSKPQPMPRQSPVPTAPEPEKPAKSASKGAGALDIEYKDLMIEKERIDKELAAYSKRYKTRSRKGVSRKKIMTLESQKKEWEKKFNDYQARKKALGQ